MLNLVTCVQAIMQMRINDWQPSHWRMSEGTESAIIQQITQEKPTSAPYAIIKDQRVLFLLDIEVRPHHTLPDNTLFLLDKRGYGFLIESSHYTQICTGE